MPQGPPDLPRLAAALASEEVQYVLVGGLALILRGGRHVTFDADLAIAFNAENRSRVVRALAPLNPRPMRLATGAAWEWDEKCIRGAWTIWMTDAGRVDLIVRLPGVEKFDRLYDNSQVMELAGAKIRVASLEDLLLMKSVSERPKDVNHCEEIRALLRLRAVGDGSND